MLIVRRVPRRATRLSAGVAAAETTTALGLAHTAAGGDAPAAGWLLTVAASAYGASALVLRGRAPMRVVLPALVAFQVLGHAWLVALTEHPVHPHDHAGDPGTFLGLTGPMLLAHLAAGAVAALAWQLRRRAVDLLVAWVPRPALLVPLRRTVVPWRALPTVLGRLATSAPTRAPPAHLPASA